MKNNESNGADTYKSTS